MDSFFSILLIAVLIGISFKGLRPRDIERINSYDRPLVDPVQYMITSGSNLHER